MSDPTNPADPHDKAADTTELPAVPATPESNGTTTDAPKPDPAQPDDPKPAAGETPAGETATGGTAGGKAAGRTAADAAADGTKPAGGTGDGRDADGGTGDVTKVDVAKGDVAKGDGAKGDGAKGDGAKGDVAKGDGAKGDGAGKKGRFRVRGPWVTAVGVVVVLAVVLGALAVIGYLWGLPPLGRLNAQRAITPPAQVAGLDRITDPEIRSQAQLDQTRDALSRINDGKKVMVEAYGSLDGDRFYVLIALRGRVDIDQVVADSGASPDKIKKVNDTTCIEAAGNLPTQCYRGSNTLTVIAQSANEGVGVDQVEPVAEEAFRAMR